MAGETYYVETYDELVEKAVETDVTVILANDINITDEYPDGDMPSLTVNCIVDGDGHTVSNWYRKKEYGNDSVIRVSSSGTIKNMKLTNIYMELSDSRAFAINSGSNTVTYYFEDCELSGIILSGQFISGEYIDKVMKNCSVNLLVKGSSYFAYTTQAYMRNAKMDNCYIKLKLDSSARFYNRTSQSNLGRDSYYEIDAPNFFNNQTLNVTFENCVLDITTDSAFTFNVTDNVGVSIINSTHAPNATIPAPDPNTNKIRAVDDEHWLDTSYLASIGFNVAT